MLGILLDSWRSLPKEWVTLRASSNRILTTYRSWVFFTAWPSCVVNMPEKLRGLTSSLLDRDNSRLKMIPEEYEKRKAIFWELLNLDCRMVGDDPISSHTVPLMRFDRTESFPWPSSINLFSACRYQTSAIYRRGVVCSKGRNHLYVN